MNSTNRDDEWEEDEGPDGDDDFDYDEFVEEEFGDGGSRSNFSPFVRITAIGLLLLFIALAFFKIGF
jgi:hypothetical protein